MKLTYKFYQCDDEFVLRHTKRIVTIAQAAFDSIPESEVMERMNRYDEVLLILKGEKLIGFNFISIHEREKVMHVGGRLVAIDPIYKGQGVLRQASLHLLKRYYFMFMKKRLTGQIKELYFFSRQCNPIAYCLLNIGQRIYPDLKFSKLNGQSFPKKIVKEYEYLKSELGLTNLNVHSGVIENGAAAAGIINTNRDLQLKWQTPWESYVSTGSELLTIFPVNSFFPLTQSLRLLKRRIKK